MSTDEHLVDTLAYAAAAVLLGFQLVFFGVAAKAFAITEGLLPEDEMSGRPSTLDCGRSNSWQRTRLWAVPDHWG